jgi:hypothetical protein
MSQRKKEQDAIKRTKERYAEWIMDKDDGGISKDHHKERKKPRLGRNEKAKGEEI